MKRKSLMISIGVILGCALIFFVGRAAINLCGFKGSSSIKGQGGRPLFGRARRLLAGGDEDGAIKEIEDLIAKHTGSGSGAEEGFFVLAEIYERRGDLLKARESYLKAIEAFPDSANVAKSQSSLEDMNVKILFSPIITQDSFEYTIQKGDTLEKISKKFNTTIELISRANDLKGNTIRLGKTLTVSKARFSIAVDKSQNILTLKADGNVVKTYKVSTGKNFSTPTGNFNITTKVVDPVWYSAKAVVPAGSPENILGSRWMAISKQGYGIHGTTDSKSIGGHVTAGCVRMTNSDAEELYAIVPQGTEVVIVD